MDYMLKDRRDYRLIPQAGVTQYVYPDRFTHNAIWDSNAGSDGKLYYGLATEIAANGYVRLCCHDPKVNDVTELFRAEDVILPQDRAIRASKFHSSIFFMPDGRMIMTPHTTDRSPRHPTWLSWGYYHHLWEGIAGDESDIATLFCYDEKNGMRALGYMQKGVVPTIDQLFGLTYVTSCAVSPDGKTIAVGAALLANEGVTVVIGGQSTSAIGAVTALKEAGMSDQVKVISIDRDSATLEAVQNGDIYATVAGKQYTEV